MNKGDFRILVVVVVVVVIWVGGLGKSMRFSEK